MIRVIRGSEPEYLSSKYVRSVKESAKKFHSSSRNSQIRWKVDTTVFRYFEVFDGLQRQFNGKCAYCESFLGINSPATVDHFRPIRGSLGLNGDFSSEHYWWYAYEWKNLYLSCALCSQTKGNRFPVDGSRCRPSTPIDKNSESILIIDPCGEGNPGDHLMFGEDGRVQSLSREGELTIEIFGLNRIALCDQRSHELKRFYENAVLHFSIDFESVLKNALGNGNSYLQMKYQAYAKWMSDPNYYLKRVPIVNGTKFDLRAEELRKVFVPTLRKYDWKPTPSLPRNWLNISEREDKTVEAQPLEVARFVERIEIRGFKSIKELNINFSGSNADGSSWKIFLGENGVGKTSLLQALALTLSGPNVATDLALNPKSLINENSKNASVRVYLSGDKIPIDLDINSQGFFSNSTFSGLEVYGYGAVRLLGVENSSSDTRAQRIANLFYATKYISGISDWLLGVDESKFNQVVRALRDILPNASTGLFVRKMKRVIYVDRGAEISLENLSDGYQTTIAMLVHLMRGLLDRWPTLDVAEGIVLIDEIGVHMHPQWKMRIVSNLREAFPRVQFVVTTHDPLCLRGIKNNEVEVIERREDGYVWRRPNLPDIESLRIDQILMSEHFGLSSTLEPTMEAAMKEYQLLMSKRTLSQDEQASLNQLREKINSASLFSRSRRERLAMQFIDEYLAAESLNHKEQDLSNMREITKKKIADIIGAKREKS
ncbi:AAA family ATPase [Bdellovibrio sp. HCB274]|uniref:AAA family ATPase n=1 Tax=Bdellovibrio sp. HCB274 TaxID=3394361 RepID=UPI0039B57155